MKIQIISILSILFLVNTLMASAQSSVHSIRNISRGASSIQIDAVQGNPAGLSKLEEGLHLSFSNHIQFQEQRINTVKDYKSKSTTHIPNLQAAYKSKKWVFSGSMGIVDYNKSKFEGLPSLDFAFERIPEIITSIGDQLSSLNPTMDMRADKYSINSHISHTDLTYGLRLGTTYEINHIFSIYGGLLLDIVKNSYKGYAKDLRTNTVSNNLNMIGLNDYYGEMANPEHILALIHNNSDDNEYLRFLLKASQKEGASFDTKQTGLGVAPIMGINIHYENLNVGIKYEFQATINTKHKTQVDDLGLFSDGSKTRYDSPSIFSIGLGYQFTPKWNASMGYNHTERNTKRANDIQKYKKKTDECSAGIEYLVNKTYLVSASGQISKQGLKDDTYQSDFRYSLDSYSVGVGGAINLFPDLQINLGYKITNYKDYTNAQVNKTYSKKRGVFAFGLDCSF